MTCECSDPGCAARPMHGPDRPTHCSRKARETLARVDMMGFPIVHFCRPCAVDALKSGVFGFADEVADNH